MQILRFYSLGDMLEPLAKYMVNADRTPDDVKNFCRDLVAGVSSCPDAFDFFNAKFVMLDKTLGENGFERIPMVDPENLDAKCTSTFDIVVDCNARVVKIFTFKVKPCDEDPFFLKALEDTYVLGQIVQ